MSLSFPVPLGAYEGADPETYMASEVVVPDGGWITYRIHLPLSGSDTLRGVAFSFRVEGRGKLLIAVPSGDKLPVRPEGKVEVGFDGRGWYVLSGDVKRSFEGEAPSDVVSLTLGASGSVSLVGETLSARLEYSGEPIRRVRVGHILDSPKAYAGKKVLLVVSPGGWGCPVKRGTPLPGVLSRSAMTLYDSTGCIYGSGRYVAGRILSPEAHPIYSPGEEKVVVVGRVRLDGKGIPYLSPDL